MKKLNIVVASLFTLSALGFLGYLVIASKTSEQKDDRKKTSEEEKNENTRLSNKNQDKTKKVDVTEILVPDGIKETTYETVESLEQDILHYLVHNSSAVTPETLLTNLIRICQKKIEYLNMDWFEKLPKNVEELENLIKDFGLYDLYLKALEK